MSESVLGDTEGNKKNLSIHCSVDPGVFFHKSEEKARRRIENVIGIVGFSFLCETQKILKRRTNPTAATTTSTSIFGDKKKSSLCDIYSVCSDLLETDLEPSGML